MRKFRSKNHISLKAGAMIVVIPYLEDLRGGEKIRTANMGDVQIRTTDNRPAIIDDILEGVSVEIVTETKGKLPGLFALA